MCYLVCGGRNCCGLGPTYGTFDDCLWASSDRHFQTCSREGKCIGIASSICSDWVGRCDRDPGPSNRASTIHEE